MKLIYCSSCHDVKKLQHKMTYCLCNKSYGRYVNNLNAEIGGLAIPIGFANDSFYESIKNQPDDGYLGERFTAFVIPKKCDTIRIKNR